MSNEEKERMEEAVNIMQERVHEVARQCAFAYAMIADIKTPEEFFPAIFSIIDKWAMDNGVSSDEVSRWMFRKVMFNDDIFKFLGGQ